jgi:hypothetical protein
MHRRATVAEHHRNAIRSPVTPLPQLGDRLFVLQRTAAWRAVWPTRPIEQA